MKIKRYLILSFLLLWGLFFFISRNPLIVDDVVPNNSNFCKELMEKSDIIYVIPNFENVSLINHPEWCEEMRNLNKTFGLHGITHEYNEFLKQINEEELKDAMNSFEYCFGHKPKLFRPPHNEISEKNRKLIERFNMTVYNEPYGVHPYCHCEPGSWIKLLNLMIFC